MASPNLKGVPMHARFEFSPACGVKCCQPKKKYNLTVDKISKIGILCSAEKYAIKKRLVKFCMKFHEVSSDFNQYL